MSLDFLTNFTWIFDIVVLIKLFALALVFFYFIFALIVSRQVSLMNQVLETSFTPVVRLVTVIQVIAVAILFFLVFLLV